MSVGEAWDGRPHAGRGDSRGGARKHASGPGVTVTLQATHYPVMARGPRAQKGGTPLPSRRTGHRRPDRRTASAAEEAHPSKQQVEAWIGPKGVEGRVRLHPQ